MVKLAGRSQTTRKLAWCGFSGWVDWILSPRPSARCFAAWRSNLRCPSTHPIGNRGVPADPAHSELGAHREEGFRPARRYASHRETECYVSIRQGILIRRGLKIHAPSIPGVRPTVVSPLSEVFICASERRSLDASSKFCWRNRSSASPSSESDRARTRPWSRGRFQSAG